MICIHLRKKKPFRDFLRKIRHKLNVVSWYYNAKTAIFNPSNKLHIRNIPRTWCDRSDRMHHVVFSMFCDFVERELGGIEKLKKDISDNKHTVGYWYKEYEEMVELYTWYTSIDWENDEAETEEYKQMKQVELHIFHENGLMETKTVGYSESERSRIITENVKEGDKFQQLCTDNAIRVLKLRGYMWT